MDARKNLGAAGEAAAIAFLVSKGVHILKRNYRCRMGEIDILARQGSIYLVIEVKTRRKHGQGFPGEAVDLRKQAKICRAFDYYRMCRRLKEDTPVRFDVIEIDQALHCRWIPNAFEYIERF